MNRDDLAKAIEAAIERFHDACPQGQGEQGDGGVAGRALCQLFYDHSDIILAALRTPDGDAMWQALEEVRACMLNGGGGAEGDFGWNISRLTKARPMIRAALLASRPVGEGQRQVSGPDPKAVADGEATRVARYSYFDQCMDALDEIGIQLSSIRDDVRGLAARLETRP